jgi:hypothetical protein
MYAYTTAEPNEKWWSSLGASLSPKDGSTEPRARAETRVSGVLHPCVSHCRVPQAADGGGARRSCPASWPPNDNRRRASWRMRGRASHQSRAHRGRARARWPATSSTGLSGEAAAGGDRVRKGEVPLGASRDRECCYFIPRPQCYLLIYFSSLANNCTSINFFY